MKRLLLFAMILGILISMNSVYACISVPKAIIFSDPLCEPTSSYYPSGFLYYESVLNAWGNKTKITEDLQKYKNYNYSCLTVNNQVGDEKYCEGCGLDAIGNTCSNFRKWSKDYNLSYFYDDWTCEEPCKRCHWKYNSRTFSLTNNDIDVISTLSISSKTSTHEPLLSILTTMSMSSSVFLLWVSR